MGAVSPNRLLQVGILALCMATTGFKWQRNRGVVEVQIYAFDASTTAFARKTPTGVGHSTFDNFTLLLFITFTLEDLEKREL